MSKFYTIYSKIPFTKAKGLIISILSKWGGYWNNHYIREIYKKDYGISIGYGTYGGCFNRSLIPSGVAFGNYCSIAGGLKIFRANHPADKFTTHPLLYNPIMGYVNNDLLDRPNLQIGHDVWIGSDVIILPSVRKIGEGAIIGAGSVVTKDIEPYTVNVGNPAKPIKRRFNDAQITYLQESEWWLNKKEDLIKLIPELQYNLNKLK